MSKNVFKSHVLIPFTNGEKMSYLYFNEPRKLLYD